MHEIYRMLAKDWELDLERDALKRSLGEAPPAKHRRAKASTEAEPVRRARRRRRLCEAAEGDQPTAHTLLLSGKRRRQCPYADLAKRFAVLIAVLLLVAGIATAASAQAQNRKHQVPSAVTPAAYSRAVTGICAHALLFEGSHPIGTRAGALEVADDIRASSRRRLSLVAALSTPPLEMRPIGQWLALEQRLADAYAATYVAIFDLIAAPWTPEQAAVAPGLLAKLMHAPDPLRQAAAHLEQQLRVPDCIGG